MQNENTLAPSFKFANRDWPGDWSEFGDTPNVCLACDSQFWGHYGRCICRTCAETHKVKDPCLTRGSAMPFRLVAWLIASFIAGIIVHLCLKVMF